jgi:S1-C subfamily serine protease
LSQPTGAEDAVVVVTATVEIEEKVSPFHFLFPKIEGACLQPTRLPLQRRITETGGGTGFALAGKIYTCNHVVAGAKKIIVTPLQQFQRICLAWLQLFRVDKPA